jgi:multiple sugar transport system permease protein
MWSVVLVDVWMWTPFMMLISLAGLSAVPKYLYEAAEVDRASTWFKFRHITLPMVAPLVLIGVLFRTMDSYKVFDTVYALTGGGPGRSTQVLSVYIYQIAFRDFNTGKGSALGYIMLIVIIALATLLIRVLNRMRAEVSSVYQTGGELCSRLNSGYSSL